MQKIIVIVIITSLTNFLYGMEKDKEDKFLGYQEDEIGIRWINDGNQNMRQEIFDTFDHSLEETVAYDDIKKSITIKNTLFMHLCVQASKTTTRNPKPLYELLQRIKDGAISIENEVITMTEKDIDHRLFSYIPSNGPQSSCMHRYLVNGKKMKINRLIKTELVEKNSHEVTEHTTIPLHETEIEIDHSCLILSEGYELKGSCLDRNKKTVIVDSEITTSYDFMKDKEHHELIVREFQNLLKK